MTALFDVLGYVALIFLGLILRLTGAVPKEAIRPLTMLLLYVTLPAVILRTLVGTEFRPEYVGIFLLGLGGNWLMIGLARFLTRKHTHQEWQFAGLNLPGYNIGIFAMPFTSGFLPPEGFLALCLFDAGNSVMCTGGTYALVCREKSGEWKTELKNMALRFFSSGPICAYILALLLNLGDVTFARPVSHFLDIIANANAFLGMTLVGLSIDLRIDVEKLKRGLAMVFWRYVVNALLAVGVVLAAPWPDVIVKAVVLVLMAPLPAMGLIFTIKAKLDWSLSANLNTVSIFISVAIMTTLLAMMP